MTVQTISEIKSAAGRATWPAKTAEQKAAQLRKMAAGLLRRAEQIEHEFSASQD